MFTLDGTRFLHDPTLYQFTLLTGITTVDDALGIGIKATDDFELLADTIVILERYAELLRDYRKPDDTPSLPFGIIFVGVLQFTKVTERPRHLIAIAFPVALARASLVSSKDLCDALCDARFLGDTNLHVDVGGYC